MQRAWDYTVKHSYGILVGIFLTTINNGPWQFDFIVIVLNNYEGNTKPFEMVFDTVEAWVRMLDLSLDKRSEAFGKALRNWLGEVVRVDVEKDGFARGKHLRI